MRRFTIVDERNYLIRPVRFFTCRGDELGKCNSCKAKFMCFTGELPLQMLLCQAPHPRVDEALEESLFGSSTLNIVEYDFESDIKFYKHSIVSSKRDGTPINLAWEDGKIIDQSRYR